MRYAIADLGFGSSGKGLMAGYLAARRKPDVVVHAFGPNSGHTYISATGRKLVHRMLGIGVVSPSLKYHLIGPGAVVDLDVLFQEASHCLDLIGNARVLIHESAAILQPHHAEAESGLVKIGSTMKGTSAAMLEKIGRNPDSKILADHLRHGIEIRAADLNLPISVASRGQYREIIEGASVLQVEGSQGHSLGISTGFWPYVTARECSVNQLLSDCWIPPGLDEVVGCARTYPIRVANRLNGDGEMVGWSGPGYLDQDETTFESVGVEPELTTVTKLPRRVFTFSGEQISEAIWLSGCSSVALGFCNYCPEDLLSEIRSTIRKHAAIGWETWGPSDSDVRVGKVL